MRHLGLTLLTVGAIAVGVSNPALAGPHHYHHRHGHSYGSVVLFSGPAYYPRPYVPYYYDYSAPGYVYPAPTARTEPLSWRPDMAQDERYCREYQTSTRIGGRSRPSYGTACMEPDGSWKIVD